MATRESFGRYLEDFEVGEVIGNRVGDRHVSMPLGALPVQVARA